MDTPTQRTLEELRAKLKAAHEGSIEVVDAAVELQLDSQGRGVCTGDLGGVGSATGGGNLVS